jgi:hypothetical protein
MFTQPRDALQAVKSLAYQQTPINVAGGYKGMLFNERILPVLVGPDHIVYRTPSLKVCIILRDPVFLYSRVLPETIRATPQLISCTTGEMRLTDFAYTGSLWFDRDNQRVQPEKPMTTDVRINGKSYPASLKDISLHGAGLLVYTQDEEFLNLLSNTTVEFPFPIAGGNSMTVNGKVAHRHSLSPSVLDLGLRIFLTSYQRTWLENFISRRKLEILSELERQITERLEPQRIKDQYF